MKRFVFFILILLADNSEAQRRLLVDTHNDVLSYQLLTGADLGQLQNTGNFDLVRAAEGGLSAQVFSIWCGDTYGKGTAFDHANREIDSLNALIRRNPGRISLVQNTSELKKAYKKHKLAAMIGVEGGHMIEDNMDYLDSLTRRGMCYLTLTWNNSTSWATSARDETLKADSLPQLGLNELGKQIVQRLNETGVMIDVSHVGETTFYDVLRTTEKPVIASHSCAYSITPHRRNLKDEQLRALAKNGGVVFVNFYSGFLDSSYQDKEDRFLEAHKTGLDSLTAIYGADYASGMLNDLYRKEADQIRPPLSALVAHIDYLVKLIGAEHVGIGSDFDGSESYPAGMDSVRDYPLLTAELKKLGYRKSMIDQIYGKNFLRVWKANRH